MRIVVTHVTRMQTGYVCVAGVDLDTGEHVRPSFRAGQRMPVTSLAEHGGPFALGRVLEIGRVTSIGRAPHTEDVLVRPSSVQCVGQYSPDQFFEFVRGQAQTQISAIFGTDLRKAGRAGAGVDPGKGGKSLGYFWCLRDVELIVREFEGKRTVRATIADAYFNLDLSVTDRRIWTDDHGLPRAERIASLRRLVRERPTAVVLALGLTKPFPVSTPLHWLQVNGIYVSGDPELLGGCAR